MSIARETTTIPARRAPILALILLLLVCYAAATAGGLVTVPEIPGWYATIAKPAWTPPNSVFGPVWGVLYGMMALAAWLAWRRGAGLAIFFVQLAFNCAWSFLFFGLHRIGLALIDIAALWLALVATIAVFYRYSRPGSLLLVPYWAWVSYAGALNGAIWLANR